jgi:hypothetical protein
MLKTGSGLYRLSSWSSTQIKRQIPHSSPTRRAYALFFSVMLTSNKGFCNPLQDTRAQQKNVVPSGPFDADRMLFEDGANK